MALTNTLAIRLELLAKEFEAQIARVNKLLEKTGDSGKKAETGMNGLVKQATNFIERGPTVGNVIGGLITKIKNTNAAVALLTVGAVAATEGLRRMFNQAVDLASEMKTMSLRTGIAVDDLSRLRVAAALSNTDFGSVTRAVSFFNRQLAAAAGGSEEAQKRLKKVGIEGNELRKALENPIEGLKMVGDNLSKLPTQAERAGRAQFAFGYQARLVVPLLGQEGKAIQALMMEAEILGNLIGPDFAEKSDQHKNALLRIKFIQEGLAISFTENLLPAVESIMTALVGLANNQLIRDFFGFLGREAAKAAIAIEGLAKIIEIADLKRKLKVGEGPEAVTGGLGSRLGAVARNLGKEALAGPFAKVGGAPMTAAEREAEEKRLAGLQKQLGGIVKRYGEIGKAKDASGIPPVVAKPAEIDHERTALERLAKSMGEVLDKITKGFDPVVGLAKAFSDLAEEGVPGMDKALANLIKRLDELAAKGDVAAKRARSAVEAVLVGPPKAEEILSPEELEKQKLREEAQRRAIETQRNLTPEETLGVGEEATTNLAAFADQLVRVKDLWGEIHDMTRDNAQALLSFSGTIGDLLVSAAENGKAAFAAFAKDTLRWLAKMIARAIIFKILTTAFPGLGKLLESVSKFMNPLGTGGFQHTESSVMGRLQESRAFAVGGGFEPALAGAGAGGEGGGRPIEVRVFNATPATYVEITDKHIMPRLDQRLRSMNERSFTRGRT